MIECGAGDCSAFLMQVDEQYAIIGSMVRNFKIQLVKIDNFTMRKVYGHI